MLRLPKISGSSIVEIHAINHHWGVQPHFCPSPNPDFDVSWEKMGKKVYGKRGKKYSF